MFKKDDRVFDLIHGEGKVCEVKESEELFYPVRVKLLNEMIGYINYTRGGSIVTGESRRLFFAEPKFSNYEEMTTRPVWKPKEREMYYFINSMGKIDGTNFINNNECDTSRLKYGNFFKTEKEAKESKFYKVFHDEEGDK